MKYALIVLLAYGATPVMAQDLSVHLSDGATWTITAEHSRRAEGGRQSQNWSLTTVKRLTWHAGAKGKPDTLTVTPISATAGAGSPPEIAGARSLAIPATLVVDQSLLPGEVVNRDEVRAEFRRLIPASADASIDLVDASAKVMIAAELATAGQAQGLRLKLGETVSADAQMSNPLGGPALHVVDTATLKAFDAKHGRAVVERRRVLDPTSLKASAEAQLATMAKDKVDPAKIEAARAFFATASMTIDTLCLYELDTSVGLARRGECFMDSAVGFEGKTEKVSEHWAITQTMPGTS